MLKFFIVERVKIAAAQLYQWKLPHLLELAEELRRTYYCYRLAIRSPEFTNAPCEEEWQWIKNATKMTDSDHLYGDCFKIAPE